MPRPVTPIGQTPSVKSPPKYPRPAPPGFFAPPPIARPGQGPTIIRPGGGYTKKKRKSKPRKSRRRRYK